MSRLTSSLGHARFRARYSFGSGLVSSAFPLSGTRSVPLNACSPKFSPGRPLISFFRPLSVVPTLPLIRLLPRLDSLSFSRTFPLRLSSFLHPLHLFFSLTLRVCLPLRSDLPPRCPPLPPSCSSVSCLCPLLLLIRSLSFLCSPLFFFVSSFSSSCVDAFPFPLPVSLSSFFSSAS